MRPVLLALVLLLFAAAARAQSLEIISLQHQSAEQLLPQLRPLLEPGGALMGTGNKLFLRTSERNREDILRVLSVLDQEPRRLLITVRQGARTELETRGAEASGDLALGDNARVYLSPRPGSVSGGTVEMRRGDSVARGRVYDLRTAGGDSISQQIQTVEGGRAYIQVGQSIPVMTRQTVMTARGPVSTESVGYQEAGTGFYVQPRLSGRTVTLEISPRRDTPGAIPGSVNVQHLDTTVSGRLGEWIPLGGSVRETNERQEGTLRYETRNGSEDRQVWLKVEELP